MNSLFDKIATVSSTIAYGEEQLTQKQKIASGVEKDIDFYTKHGVNDTSQVLNELRIKRAMIIEEVRFHGRKLKELKDKRSSLLAKAKRVL